MNKNLMVQGVEELKQDIARMVKELDVNAANNGLSNKVLKQAAVPICDQMKANTTVDPKQISGNLHDAIKTGRVKARKERGKEITIGVHRKDWKDADGEDKEYYPAYVEYGHGGPGPAPAHPYIRPAYDTRVEESYQIIRSELRKAVDSITP